ncbi:MAG: hypothetical protein MAG715_00401 [Methanonatronarchaeales archaeon]|nr:hypothetical protein [Methanonatronarchaeales archaeon]
MLTLDKGEKDVLIALFPDIQLSKRGLGRMINRAGKTAYNYAKPLIEKGLIQEEGKTIDKTHHDLLFLTDEGREVAREVVKEQIVSYEDKAGELREKLDEWEQVKRK